MDLKAMERAVQAYVPLGTDADRSRLEFFAGLYRLQDEWAHRVAAESGYPAPAAEQLEAWYWNADPAFQFAPVSIDAERFAQTLSAMAGYLAEKAGLEEAAAKGLSECDWDAFSQKADLALAGRDPAAFVESCLTGLDSYGCVRGWGRCARIPVRDDPDVRPPRLVARTGAGRDGHCAR